MRDEAFDRQQLRVYRLMFEHSREATVVAAADGRVLLLNRAARELPEDLVERLFEESGPRSADLGRFRQDLRSAGRASVEVKLDGRSLAIDGRTHGAEHVVVLRDVTAERRLEQELRALQRAESVGYLTASLVHDFNNLLTPIALLSAQLEKSLTTGGRSGEMARDIRAAAEEAAALARQMMSFARREPARVARVNLSAAVAEGRSLIERVAGPGVEVELAIESTMGEALLDRERLDHVLLNLAANARDGMSGDGRLTLRTANVVFEENGEGTPEGAASGSYVALTVTDTGVGMSSEVRERVFERFFAAREPGSGAGLGLTAVRRFMSESGGFIAVHSGTGQGTTVALYFPRVESDAAEPPISLVAHEPKRGSETVLVVDNDSAVRNSVRAVLEHSGYRVLDAAGGDRALELAQTFEDPIDLLVTEVIMPHMSGRELARRFTILRSAKVLFTSGDTDRALERHGMRPADPALLRKAFTPSDLLARVREVLDADPVSERSCG